MVAATCAACAGELTPGAKFCAICGAEVASGESEAREARKVVTILFSDLAGSTALGERLDPEQLRALMSRYFAAMSTVIKRHGGTVEKFIGDAIMAVFGIPTLHEDDALRAVRAAAEMGEALALLNAELAPRGLEIRTRTGINTGEVVTGDPDAGGTLVTGDAVNTAARLEQAAGAGEILIGERTQHLVRDAVTSEPIPPVEARGKVQPVAAHRLLTVVAGVQGHVRRLDAPLVGRDRELGLLRQTWDRAVQEPSPQLFTLLGAAGVGKSRLCAEFLGGLGDATILRGRCLPYGDGITYWPLAEVLREAAGIEDTDVAEAARAKLQALTRPEPHGEAVAARLGEAIGLASTGAAQEELFWAVRRTLESVARRRPVAVVWDDLHWAEPTFLDLVEHLADWARDAPLLIMAMARPELLDTRPTWGGGKLNATTILLEPLAAHASDELLAALPGGAALPDSLRDRIAASAEGNPLFIEEMVGMLVDEGRLVLTPEGWQADAEIDRVPVPATVSALLAARLDRLAPGERGVAERAAVVGRVFERGAVIELTPSPERADVAARLLGLVRKELVRPESEPGLGGDDAFRFRHVLIRDAAYGSLPKMERAVLHEAFADWLERVTGDRLAEYEEVVAHHLEQACQYRIELGDPNIEDLGRRAARSLTSAARRAEARGDIAAAIALCRQALALPVPIVDRLDLLIRMARCHLDIGDWDGATTFLDLADADGGNDRATISLNVLVGRWFIALQRDASLAFNQVMADARRAAAELESAGDPAGVTRALDLLAHAAFYAGDTDVARTAWRAAADWAARSGDPAVEARILPLLPATSIYGWRTTLEAIADCRELAAAHPDSPMLQARVLSMLALLHAERGDRELAAAMRDRSRAALQELNTPWLASDLHRDFAEIDTLIGDVDSAEHEALRARELSAALGFRDEWQTGHSLLEILHEQGRYGEAHALFDAIERRPAAGVTAGLACLNAWRGLLAAIDGDKSEARAALTLAVPQELDPCDQAEILELRTETHARLGESVAARDSHEAATRIYERKEMWASLKRFRLRVGHLVDVTSSGGQRGGRS